MILTAITGQPAYRQIVDDLQQKIASGAYEVGTQLPSTASLMEIYKVSTTAVRAAIRELQASGVLIGQPGKGVFVASMPAPPAGDVDARLTALTEEIRALTERVSRLESDARPRGARGQAGR